MKLWVILVVLVVVAALLVVGEIKHHRREQAARGISMATITTPDGVGLAAEVFTPQSSGAHPLVVMPTSWGATETQYQYVGRLFAASGFQVVAYTQRGFTNSGGLIDFAGSATVGDVSTVIDWALKHTDVDPKEIGALGDSYGAGVSLLAAEKDPRIRAVSALSTWTDWGYSFAPNSTVSVEALGTLLSVGQSKGRLGPELEELAGVYKTNPSAALALIDKLAPARSPIDGVAALNKNKTAVLMANGMQDSIFAPAQLVAFYDKLTGPKHLELNVGDHTQPEVQGFLTGRAIGPIGDALKWMSHYLLGTANGINTEAPIDLQDAVTGAEHAYAAWPSAVTTETLPTPAGGEGVVPQWTASISAGTATAAASARETLDLTAPYRFATANINTIKTPTGLLWSSPAAGTALSVVGTPSVRLNVTSTTSDASFFVYLYDVGPTGAGTLMSVTPQTLSGLTPGTARQVSLQLTPTAWTVAAGRHLALAVGTVDPRWTSLSTAGSTLSVSSTPASPAEFSLPAS